MQFTVLTTGSSTMLTQLRTRQVLVVASAHKARAQVVASARPGVPAVSFSGSADIARALVLWHLHYTGADNITPKRLAARLDISDERAKRVLEELRRDSRLTDPVWRNRANTYTLTAIGKDFVDYWFSRVIGGSLIRLEVKDVEEAQMLATALTKRIHGVVTSGQKLKGSLPIQAPWLVLIWVVQQSGGIVNATELSQRLLTGRSTPREAMGKFIELGFGEVRRHGKRGAPSRYALTPQGEYAASRCIAKLLT